MRLIIILKGLASGKAHPIEVSKAELDMDILSFLRSKGYPIASSCSGEGKCAKCVFNGEQLSCQQKVSEYLGKEIGFDYL